MRFIETTQLEVNGQSVVCDFYALRIEKLAEISLQAFAVMRKVIYKNRGFLCNYSKLQKFIAELD